MKRPARLALPVADWPELDRAAWQRATAPATSLFGPGAAAAKLRPATVAARAEALANWFGFLQGRGELDRSNSIDLVTPERLDLYVAEQRRRSNRNSTIAHRLEGLHAALRLIAPNRDLRFITRPGGLPMSMAFPHEPRDVTLESDKDLIAFALDLFEQGKAGRSYAGGKTAIRDAAIIGIFATRAPRNGSLAGTELGQQLRKRDGIYWLCFGEPDMKGDHPLSYPLPAMLSPILDLYIEQVRPPWGGHHTPRLWVGFRGRPLSSAALAKVVRRRTKARFDTGRGPHWFRKCMTTMAALDAPEAMLDVCAILDHSPAVSLKHYNDATGIVAVGRHVTRITRLQDKTRLLAKRAFAQRSGLTSAHRAGRTPKAPEA